MLKKVKGSEFFKLYNDGTEMYIISSLEKNPWLEDTMTALNEGRLLYEEAEEVVKPVKAEKKKSYKQGTKKVDEGKLRALYEAGWSVKEIEKEMHITNPTVYKYINKLKAEGVAPRPKAEITDDDILLTGEGAVQQIIEEG